MSMKKDLPTGVMFNAYPDSIGRNMADTVALLKRAELKDAFSLFYILPTVFHSDLDRGFSVIDYDLNEDLVSREDMDELQKLNMMFKFDLVLNHLSVASPQFLDLLQHGDESKYKNFFIDWNQFWQQDGTMGPDGCMMPNEKHLEKLFMRKPGLPILKVRFPDGSDRPYWNTFYQEIRYEKISADDLLQATAADKLAPEDADAIAAIVNDALSAGNSADEIDFGAYSHLKEIVIPVLEKNRSYLGQMDLDAKSQEVWDFYDDTFRKLRDHGGKLVRLDAFAYLHKEPGKTNFFNKPGTWEYLERLKRIADKYDLILLPEIHSQYGNSLHEEVADEGFPIYDFFLPGLIIHALERGTNEHLLSWINELIEKNISTINMLGCHDGIPVLDLKGGDCVEGLLSDEEIDVVIDAIIRRGGRVKNLFGPDGKKIAYYQVNATFYSALGEDDQKLTLARAIQMFMPGIPQVWYLDLFAGKNDYEAADKGGTAGHKEINRTTLTTDDINEGLKKAVVQDQLKLMKLRNTSPAFKGELTVDYSEKNRLHLTWKYQDSIAMLDANLKDCSFSVTRQEKQSIETVISFP